MADGFIRKRGDAWQVIVYAGRDPVTGHKRQLSRNVRGTKREAQAVRARLLVEVDDGHHVSTTATFGELVELGAAIRIGWNSREPTTPDPAHAERL